MKNLESNQLFTGKNLTNSFRVKFFLLSQEFNSVSGFCLHSKLSRLFLTYEICDFEILGVISVGVLIFPTSLLCTMYLWYFVNCSCLICCLIPRFGSSLEKRSFKYICQRAWAWKMTITYTLWQFLLQTCHKSNLMRDEVAKMSNEVMRSKLKFY